MFVCLQKGAKHCCDATKLDRTDCAGQRQSQFTPKMKANADSRLLSSLVRIDLYNECNGMTSFMKFMFTSAHAIDGH